MMQLLDNLSPRFAVEKMLAAYDLLLVHRDHLLYPCGYGGNFAYGQKSFYWPLFYDQIED
jgi:hypothetical protein